MKNHKFILDGKIREVDCYRADFFNIFRENFPDKGNETMTSIKLKVT